jgi:DNA polymerase/3'-5' exonuclease PolX
MKNQLIEVLARCESVYRHRDMWKARAYKKAQETLFVYPGEITNIEVLRGMSGIGKTIFSVLQRFVVSGNVKLEDGIVIDLSVPVAPTLLDTFTGIYGVGPKKAQELIDFGVTCISELREKQDKLLNPTQRIGLRYYEDILQRIPRAEIEVYERFYMQHMKKHDLTGEIVGSYRRGAATSGDIDVILTGTNANAFSNFIAGLGSEHLLHILVQGPSKCLVIARIAEGCPARRVDFLFTNPEQYAFAILYFTGSKGFNTAMRAHALRHGYSMNEHAIKGAPIGLQFRDERDIFDFLGLVYVVPENRVDGTYIQLLA